LYLIWPPLVFEQAWAKLHGSYESIEGGATEDALQVRRNGYRT
jgi:hypothetical protein